MRWKEIFQDVDGRFSSKRTAGFAALTAYLGAGLAALADVHLPDGFLTGLRDITIGSFAATMPDRFAPQRVDTPAEEPHIVRTPK